MPAARNAIHDFEGIVESSMEFAALGWLLAVSFYVCSLDRRPKNKQSRTSPSLLVMTEGGLTHAPTASAWPTVSDSKARNPGISFTDPLQ